MIGDFREPAREEVELLEMTWAPATQAADRWRTWGKRNTLDACPYRFHGLLTILSRRLPAGTLSPVDERLLRGLYRYQWTRNQLLRGQATTCLKLLADAGIKTMLLDGLALLEGTYPDPGMRVVHDLHILVHPEQVSLAREELERGEWRPTFAGFEPRYGNSCEFVNSHAQRLELHCYTGDECRWLGGDADEWALAQALSVGSAPTLALGPADSLLRVLLQAGRGAEPIQWMGDACAILAAFPKLDWSRLLEAAKSRRVIPFVRQGLAYLARVRTAGVPPWVAHSLATYRCSLPELLYFYRKTGWPQGSKRLLRPYLEYLDVCNPAWAGDGSQLFRFLRRRWGLDRYYWYPRRVYKALERRVLALFGQRS